MRISLDIRVSHPADSDEITVALGRPPIRSGPPVQHPRPLDHDIRHELGTIALSASLLGTANEVRPDSRRRAEEIDPLMFWRVSTTLVGNAVRAAGARRRGGCRVRPCLPMLPSGYAEGWLA
jgi:hypothetical protein